MAILSYKPSIEFISVVGDDYGVWNGGVVGEEKLFVVFEFPMHGDSVVPGVVYVDEDHLLEFSFLEYRYCKLGRVMGGFAETEVELLLECDFGEIGEVAEKVARVQYGIVILFEAEDIGEAAGIALVTPFGAEVAGADGGNRKIIVLIHRAVGDRFVFHYFVIRALVEGVYPSLQGENCVLLG